MAAKVDCEMLFLKKNQKPWFSKFIISCGIYNVGIIINMRPNSYDKAEVRTFAQTIDQKLC